MKQLKVSAIKKSAVLACLAVLTLLLGMAGGAGAQVPPGGSTTPLLWLKAGAGVYSDAGATAAVNAGAVQQWNDQSGHGTVFSQTVSGRRPSFVASDINGLPALHFPYNSASGNATSGEYNLLTTGLTSTTGSYTVFMVVNDAQQASNNGAWALDSQSGRLVFRPNTTSSGGGYGWYDGGGFQAVGTYAAGWKIAEWVMTAGASGQVLVNGTNQGTAPYAQQPLGGTTSLGGAYDGNSAPLNGDLAEVILYNSVLGASERSTIRSALGAKYALAITSASMTVSPGSLASGSTGNTVTLTGTNTAWTTGTTFSLASTGTGAAITAQSVSGQVATLTVTAGTAGTLTFSDSADAATAGASVANGPVTIAPNSAGILYSPYNWLVTSTAAKTINAGAYFRTLLTATATCKIGLTVGAATPYSEMYARLDGGAWQEYIPSASGAQVWTLTMPTPSTAPNHLLEFLVKSTTETQNRWNSQTTAVQLTGLTLDSGASVTLPASRKYRVLIYGDSITEGVRVNGSSGITNDTDRNDNTLDYSYKLGELLDAEVGVVGFGGSGMTVTGSGNVPPLPASYNLLWSGQTRAFSPVPDLVIYNETTNEQSAALASLTAAFSTVVSGVGFSGATSAGLAGTRHLIMEPFGGYQAANLQAISSGFGSANVVYGSTSGFWSSADSSDGLHPYAYAHLGNIAPKVAALAMPLLYPSITTSPKRRLQ